MSDDDSGSGSDSGAGSGWTSESGPSCDGGWSSSSSDDSAGRGGIDLTPLVENLFDGLLEPQRSNSATVSGPSQAERERQARFEETLRTIFFASGPARDDRSLVRRVVEAERWFLATAPDGSPLRQSGVDAETTEAFSRPLTGSAASAQRVGRETPESFLRASLVEPTQPARRLSGRELARAIPADAGGLLLALDADTAVGFHGDELPLLAQLADSLDLEQLLLHPAPGHLPALQAARWYVPAEDKNLDPMPPGWGSPTISIYTHPDRQGDGVPIVELDGRSLCVRLADRDDYIGLSVNGLAGLTDGATVTQGFAFGPSFARGVARGVDPRPGAAPLPARTLAEVILWLDLAGFPWQAREIVPADPVPYAVQTGARAGADARLSSPDGAVLIQVRSPESSTWRIHESIFDQPSRSGPTVSPVFALARPESLPADLPAPLPPAFVTVYGGHLNPDELALTPASIDLGEGATEILCAGRLVRWLDRNHTAKAPGWLVSKADRLRAARMAGWADELLKLMPPGADTLPRSSLLTLDGADFLRTHAWIGTRDWLEQKRQAHARAASRRFNF